MKSAAHLASLLRKGLVDPVAVAEQTLEEISRDGDQSIFIDIFSERALREATASRKRLKNGQAASLADGVPVGWKDLFDIAGRVTTAGSVVLKSNAPAEKDAALVATGKRAGLISIGSLNMTEFAYSGIGLNPHYGTPRNPCDLKVHRSPGGSSSGSAVAVAKGLLPVAFGTDTGGSIRIPASFNGIVGYKASTRHYPMGGVFPLSRTYDALGPFANSVEDCVLVDAVMRGQKRVSVRRGNVKGRIFIVPTNTVFEGVEDAVAANFERTLSRISRAGGKIKRQPFPVFHQIVKLVSARGNILGAEALHLHFDRVNGPAAEKMDQRVVQRIKVAERMSAVDLVEIHLQREQAIAAANVQVGNDIVVYPTTAHVAMPVEPLERSMEDFVSANLKTLRNTMIGNFLDWCGLSVPNGMAGDGMPTGFLLSARHGRDNDLLSIGLALEPLIRG